ncbi:hypothetical protein IIA79_03610 [bacterium]|nr:hypothetical protein [bacterium]
MPVEFDGPPAQAQSPTDVVAQLEAQGVPDGVAPDLWSELTAELVRVLQDKGVSALEQHPPEGIANRVTDLQLIEDGGSYSLEWTYVNVGDYDQNSEVNISDLTPVGQHFGAREGDADWDAAQLADGDGNGEVNIADVTPIGQKYLSQVAGYRINGSYLLDGPWTEFGWLEFSEAGGSPRRFSFQLDGSDYSTYYVAPLDHSGREGATSAALVVQQAKLTLPLAASQDAGFTDADNELVWSIGLAESLGLPASVELIEIDSMGSELGALSDMWDDGDPAHGDAEAGDRIYSAKTIINKAAEGQY